MNEQEFKILGISAFHSLGYTGKNIKILSCERIIENQFLDVNTPFGRDTSKKITHGTVVMDYLSQVVPDAIKYSYPISGTFSSTSYSSKQIDHILNNSIDIVTTSQVGTPENAGKMKALRDCIDNNTFFCCSAGNDGSNGMYSEAQNDEWISVGAIHYDNTLSLTKQQKINYSSIGEALDFMSLSNLENSYGGHSQGTSFSTPVFAGMVGLVQDFFIQNTGKKLTYDTLLQFIKDNCIDLGIEGKDTRTGYGLFILPDPKIIDINKYIEMGSIKVEKNYNTKIELTIDSKDAYINNTLIKLDEAPTIINNRTFVPLRFISETFGYDVEWDNINKKVTIKGTK